MESFLRDIGLILVGSAIFSVIAVLLKQPIIVAYLLCGAIFGPWGIGWIRYPESIERISHIGITLLLFLAGLTLHPQKLLKLFKNVSLITLASCLASFVIAFVFAWIAGFAMIDCMVIGLALMFSSTILVVKLLPTTTLHQQRLGAVCISILILEDLLAVAVLALIRSLDATQGTWIHFLWLSLKLVIFIGILFLLEQYVLTRLMLQVERLHELIFILGLAWCFGIAAISNHMGLFYETGAFFAGVAIARHKISLFISENLKPLRDFFLVLFFFTLGANLNIIMIHDILLPALMLAGIFIVLKPWIFGRLFVMAGEKPAIAREIGFRMGQLSEFSLLIALLALETQFISPHALQFIDLVTIVTFVASSYIVVLKFPTPIGVTEKLIRD